MIVGDRHFKFDPLPFYTSTSGAMQRAGFDIPSCSRQGGITPENVLGEAPHSTLDTCKATLHFDPTSTMATKINDITAVTTHTDWQLPRRVSPQKDASLAKHIETDTSNSFSATVPPQDGMSEGETSSGVEELDSFSNDPLDSQGEQTSTPKVRKGPGRRKK